MRKSEDKVTKFFSAIRTASILGLTLAAAWASAEGNSQTKFTGIGFIQMGKIGKSSDTLNNNLDNNYNGTWQQGTGAMIVGNTTINENWSGAFGLGVVQAHISRGNRDKASLWYPFWVPFVSEADVKYTSSLGSGDAKWYFTLGAFPYNYNPDVKNLGLYLLRGYVYPGLPVSGFEAKPISGGASQTGGLIGFANSTLSNDLIVNIETEDKPLYDISVADVATWKVANGLELGAGFNLYRVLANDSKITSPGKDCIESRDFGIYSLEDPHCFVVEEDTTTKLKDTVLVSLSGTKLMGRIHFDPKAALGFSGHLGPNDLVIYSEVAVFGLKDYKTKTTSIYGDLFRRMPIMVGFNLPAFGYLDYLNVEVEYYASKLYPDQGMAQAGSAVPRVVPYGNGRNDWKWSVYASRVLANHIKLSAQIANDHLRLGGFHNLGTGAEALSTPKDWYWMTKLAFFF